jgi:hypothetical protein
MSHAAAPFWLSVALLPLAACTESGSSSRRFALTSTGDLVDGARWAANRPIELRFDRPIDFGTVGPDTVRIFELGSGAPARGRFAVSAEGEGRVLVFQPSCPLDAELRETGLKRGARYRLAIPGGKGSRARVVRSRDGAPLALGRVLEFEIEDDPARAFVDSLPGAGPRVIAASLGSEPIYPDPRAGARSEPFVIAANTFAAPAEPLVLHFDQPLHPRGVNLSAANLRLAFRDGQGVDVPVPVHTTLVESCGRFGATVMLSPIGVLPAGEVLVLQVGAELEDLVGERAGSVVEPFALRVARRTEPVVFDRLFEELGTPSSFDAESLQVEPRAEWSPSERALVATSGFPREALASEFDWVVRGVQILDTSTDLITDASSGRVQSVENGVVHVRSLRIEAGAVLYAQGPLPLQIWCAGDAVIDGVIDLSGCNAFGPTRICYAQFPAPGAPGRCSGGDGGAGSPETTRSSTQGGRGQGAYGALDQGGAGGESGLGVSSQESRAAGGGGGTWRMPTCLSSPPAARSDEGRCGRSGAATSRNCAGRSPTVGGEASPAVLNDGSIDNDFFGLRIDASTGTFVRGEVARLQGGAGGGGGGDAITYSTCTHGNWNQLNSLCDLKGGGGGGGGGALRLSVLGPLHISGSIRATGGAGASGQGPFGGAGPTTGGAGGGAGGMLMLMSATRIDLSGAVLDTRGGIGGGGAGRQGYPSEGAGGHGGAGIIQFHVPDPARNLISSQAQVFPTAVVLEPDFGSRSAAQTRWFDTGFAQRGSSGAAPRYEFDGVETQGVDAGLVRRSGRETVEPPAPLPERYRVRREDLGRSSARLAGLPAGISDPSALIGWRLLDARRPTHRGYAIVAAQRSYGALHLALDPAYGDLAAQLRFENGAAELALAPRFFRLDVEEEEDRYPDDLAVYVQFQGADASVSDPSVPDLATLVPTPGNPFTWTADPEALRGKRFVRSRLSFEQNAQGAPRFDALRPVALRHLHLPFRF